MTTDPNIGHLLSNRYQLVELVGKGAMGRVYRAEDVLLGGVIAVKFLSQALIVNDSLRKRFKFEARTCAQLGQKSIHIVRVTDYGINEDDVPYYVMEYLQGESLSEIISTQTLLLPRFLSLARQICLGLQCAHQGILMDGQLCPIIHRDIKPSNILVSQNALLGELVKILDFGIAKLLQEDSGQTSSFMGTLPYSSPEQMEGQDLNARSDIYSLGIMMFEMLTGKMPLQAETHTFGAWYKAHHSKPPRTFKSVNPTLKVPNALETLVMGCLEKKAADRPQSIVEVLKALEPLEQRYSANHHIGNRISEALAKKPLIEERSRSVAPSLSGDIAAHAMWPKDKPVAQIVFPQIFSTGKESVPTIWVMLPQKEIHSLQVNRIYNRIYKNFLCSMSPHPMVLWLTAIYNRFHSKEQGPRWLRCYLDLKTPFGQEMLRLMGETGQYQVLLFALEDPPQCAHGITITIHPSQCSLLKQWAIASQSSPSLGHPSMTKNLLQAEFEKLKPKIVEDLEITSNSSPWV
ncbi:serine/threonine protein kinase [Phormidium sp. CLA17]|uniref:serine/threonine protein kinase n=1 Tax=Leptolyngbya sp. Cla-17 TaxID=2803751 RepID=UPI0014916408|nr:serine/threonine-protein kinase [Leptolyngbya sp. Cla-17]MBM0740648.1 serine/threonine protein kinase [Leptolyngbya sp. Cla-17]